MRWILFNWRDGLKPENIQRHKLHRTKKCSSVTLGGNSLSLIFTDVEFFHQYMPKSISLPTYITFFQTKKQCRIWCHETIFCYRCTPRSETISGNRKPFKMMKNVLFIGVTKLQSRIILLSTSTIGEGATNILICYFSKQLYLSAHQTKYLHVEN